MNDYSSNIQPEQDGEVVKFKISDVVPRIINFELIESLCNARCRGCPNAIQKENGDLRPQIGQMNRILRLAKGAHTRVTFNDDYESILRYVDQIDPNVDCIQFSIPTSGNARDIGKVVAQTVSTWITPRMHLRSKKTYPKVILGNGSNVPQDSVDSIRFLSHVLKDMIDEFERIGIAGEFPNADIRTSINDYRGVDLGEAHAWILHELGLDPGFVPSKEQLKIIERSKCDYLVHRANHRIPGLNGLNIGHRKKTREHDRIATDTYIAKYGNTNVVVFLRSMRSRIHFLQPDDEEIGGIILRLLDEKSLSLMFESAGAIHIGHSARNVLAKKHKFTPEKIDSYARKNMEFFMSNIVHELLERS